MSEAADTSLAPQSAGDLLGTVSVIAGTVSPMYLVSLSYWCQTLSRKGAFASEAWDMRDAFWFSMLTAPARPLALIWVAGTILSVASLSKKLQGQPIVAFGLAGNLLGLFGVLYFLLSWLPSNAPQTGSPLEADWGLSVVSMLFVSPLFLVAAICYMAARLLIWAAGGRKT
jgi:hypothetical protein